VVPTPLVTPPVLVVRAPLLLMVWLRRLVTLARLTCAGRLVVVGLATLPLVTVVLTSGPAAPAPLLADCANAAPDIAMMAAVASSRLRISNTPLGNRKPPYLAAA